LLHYEWSLPNSLETLALTGSTISWLSAWFTLGALASAASIGPIERNRLLGTLYTFHEVDVKVNRNVSSPRSLNTFIILRASTFFAAATSTTEHFLKLFENVTKASSLTSEAPLSSATTTLLETTTGEATWEAATEGILTTEWVLSLLISSHASLIVNTSLLVVAESLIRVVDL